MLFRLIGLLLIAAGFGLVWLARPTGGKPRIPPAYESWYAILVTALIGMGLPFLAFGAPGFESPGSTLSQ
jgi:hypothetical protein